MICAAVAGVPIAAQQAPVQDESKRDRHKAGHSAFGEAYDQGPREKPDWIDGIGKVHFQITTKVPDVQRWFDQGMALLHSFWYYEAERTFRWAVKLDPGAAMGYWGLAQAAGGGDRAKSFIKEASKRKGSVTPRERAYIEAWEHSYGIDGEPANHDKFRKALEKIVLDYPDDIEAKALFGLSTMGGNGRLGTDLLLKQVIAKAPDHPGAHHYRIHNWDDEQGAQALESCRKYGEIVFGIGHALHMPGHIYTGVGMWHEAALSMDGATRAEIAYMGRRLVFPYNTWNYAHNRSYLSYIQEQLGMEQAAIRGAREILAVPLDPKLNDATRYSPHWRGVTALTRALVKFERWDEILAANAIPWGPGFRDKVHRGYVEALAHIGKKNLEEANKAVASYIALKKEIEKPENKSYERQYAVQALELEGTLALMKGDELTGLAKLSEAAPKDLELRGTYDDPPDYPTIIYRKLGRAYLAAKSPTLALKALEKALAAVPNDGFTLAAMVEANHALGRTADAREAYGRLLFVWSDADASLQPLQSAKATGLTAEAVDRSPGRQRNYRKASLDKYGPPWWTPFAAPSLAAVDAAGKRVTLEEYRGKNVVLVFYLGGSCPHCVKQLKDLSEKQPDLARLDAEVLAVSPDTVGANSESKELSPLKLRLLSDEKYENARRFKSYDDFEEMPIHSTLLIDKEGKVHWANHGGAPFTDYTFILDQLRRMNEKAGKKENTDATQSGTRSGVEKR